MAHSGNSVLSVSWVRQPDGEWQRHMLRECTSCAEFKTMPMIYVDMNSLFCLHCLSGNVFRDLDAGPWLLRCEDCNHLTQLDDLNTDDEDFDVEIEEILEEGEEE